MISFHRFLTACATLSWALAAWAAVASAQIPAVAVVAASRELSIPYDLREAPRLTKSELQFILSQKLGAEASIRVSGDFLEVSGGLEEQSRFLSLFELFEFLRRRSSDFVSRLRTAGKQDLNDRDRADAVHILHERYMFLSREDRDFLEKLFSLRYGKIASPERKTAPPAAPAPRYSVLKPPRSGREIALLRRELRQKLIYPNNEKERAALDNILDQLMKSPTARELTRDFINQGRPVKVSFGDIEGSKIIEARGQKTFTGLGGYTEKKGSGLQVVLNKHYLPTDPDGGETASMLAHELLGHARQEIKAAAAGVSLAYKLWEQDEVNAGLIGWVVMGELGLRLNEGLLWKYLEDPAGYPQILKTYGYCYAATLSRAEMQGDVAAALSKRKEGAEIGLAGLDKEIEENERYRRTMEHFMRHPDHQMSPSQFEDVKQSLDNKRDAGIPYRKMNLQEIIERMGKSIDYCRGKNGLRDIAVLRKQAESGFFRSVEAENTDYYAVLLKLARGKTWEKERPPLPPGQLSWREFLSLCEKDEKVHPDLEQP